MEIGQTIYYLEQGIKFPNIYPCTIINISDKITIESDHIEPWVLDHKSFEQGFVDGILHTNLLSALNRRRELLGQLKERQTKKFNTLIKKIDKWRNKRK